MTKKGKAAKKSRMTRTRKVLIGAGIGCGTLLVVAIALVVAGGLWATKVMGDIGQVSDKWVAQDHEFEGLDRKYPFPPSLMTRAMPLTEERLQAYLAVRDATLPAHAEAVAKGKALMPKPDESRLPNPSRSFGAATALYEYMYSLRATLLVKLEANRMSTRELTAITLLLYPSTTSDHVARRRAELQEEIDRLGLRAASVTGFEKAFLEEQIKMSKRSLEMLPPTDLSLQADAALLARHQDAISRNANPAFDRWLAEGLKVSLEGFGVERPWLKREAPGR